MFDFSVVMNIALRRRAWDICLPLCVTAGWLLTGCASTPKVDWNSRIGSFTYDQTVAEMGPPDKSTQLSDGSSVAEWFVKQGSSFSFGVGTGRYSGGSSVGVGQSVNTSRSGQF